MPTVVDIGVSRTPLPARHVGPTGLYQRCPQAKADSIHFGQLSTGRPSFWKQRIVLPVAAFCFAVAGSLGMAAPALADTPPNEPVPFEEKIPESPGEISIHAIDREKGIIILELGDQLISLEDPALVQSLPKEGASGIPLVSIILQGIIAAMFTGSLVVAGHHLRTYKKASTTESLRAILDDYNEMVQEGVFDSYDKDLETWKEKLAASEKAPVNFYLHHLKSISRIGQFYERVGLLVRQDLVNFDLLFEMLPFPDKFWNETQEFRKTMSEITYVDFWNHFESLHRRYENARKNKDEPKDVSSVLPAVRKRYRKKYN